LAVSSAQRPTKREPALPQVHPLAGSQRFVGVVSLTALDQDVEIMIRPRASAGAGHIAVLALAA